MVSLGHVVKTFFFFFLNKVTGENQSQFSEKELGITASGSPQTDQIPNSYQRSRGNSHTALTTRACTAPPQSSVSLTGTLQEQLSEVSLPAGGALGTWAQATAIPSAQEVHGNVLQHWHGRLQRRLSKSTAKLSSTSDPNSTQVRTFQKLQMTRP